MIYKLTFKHGRIDWCTAKNELHLLKSYDAEFDLPLREVEDLQLVKDEEAKTIMVKNTEYNPDEPDDMPEELCLFDLGVGDEFCVIASTEFD